MKYLPYARNVLQVFIYIISFNLPQLTNEEMETMILLRINSQFSVP